MAGKDLFALLSMTFLYVLGRSIVAPFSPLYFQSVNITILGIGILLGGFGFAFLVSEALWGFVSSRFLTRKTLLVFVVLSAVLSVPMSRPQSFAVLFIIQLLGGVCFGGVGVFARLVVPRLTDVVSRAKSFGYLGLVFSFGTMAGSLVGGEVYSTVGLSSSFIVAAAISLLPLVPLWWLRLGQNAENGQALVGSLEPDRPPVKLRGAELAVTGLVGLTTAAGSIFYNLLLPNILARDQSYSASVFDISLVIALFSLSSGLFQPLLGLRGSKSPRVWILGALGGSGTTFLVLLLSHSLLVVYVVAFLTGAASAAITPLALSILTSGVPRPRLGRAFGLYGAAENSGIIVGSLAGGAIWAEYGTGSVFLSMAILCFSAGALYGIAALGPGSRPN